MEKANLAYEAKMSKANAKSKFLASLLNAGASGMKGYATYDKYWGSTDE
jgi:hypothetical protein